jgi:hypothetical protein
MTKRTQLDGLPIIDSNNPLVLRITQRDINGASIKDPENCAVARACRRELHAIEVRVHLARTYVRLNRHNWIRYMTPRPLRDELIAFDRGGTFEPGEYQLSMLSPSNRSGVIRRGGIANGKGKRRKHHIITNVRTGPA